MKNRSGVWVAAPLAIGGGAFPAVVETLFTVDEAEFDLVRKEG